MVILQPLRSRREWQGNDEFTIAFVSGKRGDGKEAKEVLQTRNPLEGDGFLRGEMSLLFYVSSPIDSVAINECYVLHVVMLYVVVVWFSIFFLLFRIFFVFTHFIFSFIRYHLIKYLFVVSWNTNFVFTLSFMNVDSPGGGKANKESNK